MKKAILFLLTIIIYTGLTFAQSGRGTIIGKIIDSETKEPIPSTTIRILTPNDSTLITGAISSKEGTFSIPLNFGNYITQFSFMGYTDKYEEITITPENPNIRLDTVTLRESSILLDETVITAQSLEIVVRGDTLEYNASAYNVAEMAVVEDLLKQMPGVEIDASGTIKVQGKEIKNICRRKRVLQRRPKSRLQKPSGKNDR